MNKEFTISELESLLRSTQIIIDNTTYRAKINGNDVLNINQKLGKLTNYRTKIMDMLERKLDDIFKED